MLEAVRSKKLVTAVLIVAAVVLLIVFNTSSKDQNAAPTAKAKANTTSGAAPLKVTFSSDGSTDPDDDKLRFEWSFGDGTTSTQEDPSKTFDKKGEYSVVLKVNDGHDHTVSATPIKITVSDNVQGVSTENQTGQTLGTSTNTPRVRFAAVTAPTNNTIITPVPNNSNPNQNPNPTTPTPDPNLIPNGSFASEYPLDPSIPLHWIKGSYGDNLAEFFYETTGRTDNTSASITMSQYVYGDAKWIFEAVDIVGGTNYTFSDWYKATTDTELLVDWTLDDGTHQYDLLAPVAAASDWTKLTRSLTAPANAVKVSVHHMIKANGTLTVDDYNLVTE